MFSCDSAFDQRASTSRLSPGPVGDGIGRVFSEISSSHCMLVPVLWLAILTNWNILEEGAMFKVSL